jgi:hypothetical protein
MLSMCLFSQAAASLTLTPTPTPTQQQPLPEHLIGHILAYGNIAIPVNKSDVSRCDKLRRRRDTLRTILARASARRIQIAYVKRDPWSYSIRSGRARTARKLERVRKPYFWTVVQLTIARITWQESVAFKSRALRHTSQLAAVAGLLASHSHGQLYPTRTPMWHAHLALGMSWLVDSGFAVKSALTYFAIYRKTPASSLWTHFVRPWAGSRFTLYRQSFALAVALVVIPLLRKLAKDTRRIAAEQ